ncbi:FecR family protein [Echinicola sediminis]
MKSQEEELLKNKEFIRWVNQPNDQRDRYWKAWLETHPERRDELFRAREIVLGLKVKRKALSDQEKEEILSKIISSSNRRTGDINAYRNKKGWSRSWKNYPLEGKAAALFLFAVLSIFLLKKFIPETTPQTETATKITIVKTTSKGQKSKFRLPDGTIVWLNADSKLVFPKQFSDSTRVVQLTGEGYFDVAKDPKRPFTVSSKNLSTTALGTAFNINTFDKDQLDVSLVHGKVKVENHQTKEKIILAPGQKLSYFESDHKTVVGDFDGLQVTGWKDGILYLKNAKYDQVINRLENWYGVTISTTGKPKLSWTLTGKYEHESLEMVLNRMSYVEHFDYSINQNKVQIKF